MYIMYGGLAQSTKTMSIPHNGNSITCCSGDQAEILLDSRAKQSTLLVSRPHPDENGCGREVIIHYSLFPVKNSEGLGRLWHIWHCQLQLYQVLCMGAKHRTYIIHDTFFIHNTHRLFRVANKNLVQR